MTSPRLPLVTIAVPIFKRLGNLPHILEVVRAQTYPAIELLLSDNGRNGHRVTEIADACLFRHYKFRQNASTVSAAAHFNQLLAEASGEYFVLLCDDDEISPNYVSELVQKLQASPDADVAIARQELMDIDGTVVRRSRPCPASLSGTDFILRSWRDDEFKYECFVTVMLRRKAAIVCGGYPDFPRANGSDNALLAKLCLGRHVVFGSEAVFRWRIDETSHGWSASIHDLAVATRQFLDFLDNDPWFHRYARAEPQTCQEIKAALRGLAWQTYWYRWKGMYRPQLSRSEWIKAAFALPWIGAYYRRVIRLFVSAGQRQARASLQRLLPRPSPGA